MASLAELGPGPGGLAERYLRECGSGLSDYAPPWSKQHGGERVEERRKFRKMRRAGWDSSTPTL
ncbi:hypothetical protein FPOAC2_05082 [Fusarium poae]|uniref:hypothetical protein n=1 Tax=Fusarium poae TaxID=36050 RepID=UPI001CE89AE4|nr:hypothetical protein FPOAC1_004979 [Fusarium poae]KAG8671724.1 hypothetical protein FPOAC1_004979 [Fusarium poae]